jgi:hypothetical protein
VSRRDPQPETESRPELLVAATLYLMTHYMRSGCPKLACCISRHMQCLALHAGADPKIRDVCAALHGAWQQAAGHAHEEIPDSSHMH